MANLHILEFYSLAKDSSGVNTPVPDLASIAASQNVSFTTSTQSASFQSQTRFLRLFPDAKCFVKFGSSPMAKAADIPIAADFPEYFAVHGGKLAVYDGTS